jgi:hypothetical protein
MNVLKILLSSSISISKMIIQFNFKDGTTIAGTYYLLD